MICWSAGHKCCPNAWSSYLTLERRAVGHQPGLDDLRLGGLSNLLAESLYRADLEDDVVTDETGKLAGTLIIDGDSSTDVPDLAGVEIVIHSGGLS